MRSKLGKAAWKFVEEHAVDILPRELAGQAATDGIERALCMAVSSIAFPTIKEPVPFISEALLARALLEDCLAAEAHVKGDHAPAFRRCATNQEQAFCLLRDLAVEATNGLKMTESQREFLELDVLTIAIPT